jgi:hypothetical protein
MSIDKRVAAALQRLTFAMTLVVPLGCAAGAQSAPAPREAASNAATQDQATVPLALRGTWYPDDVQGRAKCESYLRTDAMTIERTGSDPLVGAVVATPRMIHRYSEYGEGDFFRVDRADKQSDGAWMLSGQVFVDSRPDDGMRGLEHAERFEMDADRLSFSSSDRPNQRFFRCGDVRGDLYSMP